MFKVTHRAFDIIIIIIIIIIIMTLFKEDNILSIQIIIYHMVLFAKKEIYVYMYV